MEFDFCGYLRFSGNELVGFSFGIDDFYKIIVGFGFWRCCLCLGVVEG